MYLGDLLAVLLLKPLLGVLEPLVFVRGGVLLEVRILLVVFVCGLVISNVI